jgi:hypothetical protein
MNNKIKITLLACLLIATVGLFAQGQQSFNFSNKHFPSVVNNSFDSNSKHLGKSNYNLMLDSITYFNFFSNPITYPQTLRFYYDINGNNTLSINSINFDQQISDYVKTDNTFNSSNQPTLELSSMKDSSGNWVENYKNISEYDLNGNRSSYKHIVWNTIDKTWDFQNLNHSTYDSSNKITSQIDTNYIGIDYKVYKTDYSYDDKGILSNYNMYVLQNSIWTNNSKYVCINDSTNNINTVILSIWDGAINDYVNSGKYVYSIDSNGKKRAITNYSWNNFTWVVVTRDVFTFNDQEINEEVAYPANFSFKQPMATYLIQYRSDSNWINNSLQTCYYSSFKAGTGINELTETSINIYPNPTTGFVNINTKETIENIYITDINGKLVHHQTNNSPIDLSQQAKGIYFVNFNTEKGVINKKIVLN